VKKIVIALLVAALAVTALVLLQPALLPDGPAVSPTGSAVLVSDTIALVPRADTVPVGGDVLVDVVANDIDNVFGVQLSFSYDPAALEFQGIDEGAFLSRSGADQTMVFDVMTLPQPGLVKDFVVVKIGGDATSGSGVIGTLRFRSLTSGPTAIGIPDALLGDRGGNPIPVSVEGTTVTVS
jgi:hypothetical protein